MLENQCKFQNVMILFDEPTLFDFFTRLFYSTSLPDSFLRKESELVEKSRKRVGKESVEI